MNHPVREFARHSMGATDRQGSLYRTASIRAACAIRLLQPLLLLLMLPAAVQAQLTFTTNNGAITITGYIGAPTVLVIPSATNSYPVTSIGQGAFSDCTSLTSVAIPNSVTSIGERAFNICFSLTNVIIGDGVTTIG